MLHRRRQRLGLRAWWCVVLLFPGRGGGLLVVPLAKARRRPVATAVAAAAEPSVFDDAPGMPEAIPSDVTLGAAAPFLDEADSKKPAQAMLPATLGDPNGHWHGFAPLEGGEVYCRGTTDAYHWTQNRETVQLLVKLPDGPKPSRRDVAATTRRDAFSLACGEVDFGGPLSHPVDADLSHWYFDQHADGSNFVVVDLAKADEFWNWASVFRDETPDENSDGTVGDAAGVDGDAGAEAG